MNVRRLVIIEGTEADVQRVLGAVDTKVREIALDSGSTVVAGVVNDALVDHLVAAVTAATPPFINVVKAANRFLVALDEALTFARRAVR